MSNERSDWLKGTLPAWIATSLIAMLCFIGIKYLDHVNSRLEEGERNKAEISVHAVKLNTLETAVLDLKNGQKEVLNELRTINVNLRRVP